MKISTKNGTPEEVSRIVIETKRGSFEISESVMGYLKVTNIGDYAATSIVIVSSATVVIKSG